MVNFNELNSRRTQPLVTEPRQLFQSLQRDKSYEYLRDVQGDVLDEWYQRREERDLVIKMNTGSGKTLVGLVLLWSRLQEGKGPALYLCPDNYLVSQVRREADVLGIKHVDFEPGNRFPSEFYDSSGILITNVQKLFNGLSIFRVAGRPDPVKVGTILVDDAHSCINIARDQFTAQFPRDSEVGKRLWNFFDGSLQQQSVGIYADVRRGRHDAYLRVPYWSWQERLQDVANLFSVHSESDDLKFVWPFLREGEVLTNSTAAVSGGQFEVAPLLVPIELVPSFDRAEHRIYMSATLVDDAALIKNFTATPTSIEKPISPKIAGDIGERLIISPALVDSNVEEITTTRLVLEIRDKHQANVVVLTPSRQRFAIWSDHSPMQAARENISDVIGHLSRSQGNTAILANRYDGIDLPYAACHVLVLDELPQEHRLSNRIEATARRDSPFLKKQIVQKIEQGMGRGVRSRTDYCVVILTGKRLVDFITDVDNQAFFTSETKKQFNIGKTLSDELKRIGTNAYQAILDLVTQCLDRDQGWQEYHRAELQGTETSMPYQAVSSPLASAELKAWQYASKGQYEAAAGAISNLINSNELSDIDVGWYLQLQAEYLYHSDQASALEKQLKAHDLNRNLLKTPQGVNYRKIQAKQSDQANEVLNWVKQSTDQNALVSRANVILESLAFGVSHEVFEQALHDLAKVIGFAPQRPDHDVGRGPDVLWRMPNSHYLIFESKNEADVGRQEIYKKEAEQLGHHITWFKHEYPGESYTPILIHPATVLANDAYLEDGTIIMQSSDIQNIAESVRQFAGVLASKPTDQWTSIELSTQLQTYRLRPADLFNRPLGKGPTRLRR